MASHPEMIANYRCRTGEGPLWHPMERRLYWTDIPAGRMFRYDPATNTHEQFYDGRPVGGFTIQQDGSLLLFMDRGTVACWRDGVITTVIEEIAAEREFRFNDVIADPLGRVFCGIVDDNGQKGRLYRLDPDGTLTTLLEGIGCSNGMAFTADQKLLYYTDSLASEIYVFDYDVETGAICNQHVFARFGIGAGMPDGVTLDSQGRLWSALWDGYAVVRLREDGSVAEKMELPTAKVSSVTFGGEDMKDMYITTAGGDASSKDDPAAGALFRARMDVAGVPEFFSRIRIPTRHRRL
jgi:D-xylono/L-arabinono-1,4-lactonase